jgi:hypothetical protein
MQGAERISAWKACGRRLVAKRAAGRRKVYHYLVCSTYSDSAAATCELTRCHRAGETKERVAEFVLGLLRDPEVLGEEAERQAEGERRRLQPADREAERLRGLTDKRERLMDLALDGPFGKDGTLVLTWSCGEADFDSRHGPREPHAPAGLCTR